MLISNINEDSYKNMNLSVLDQGRCYEHICYFVEL